jgi:aqualysin 1
LVNPAPLHRAARKVASAYFVQLNDDSNADELVTELMTKHNLGTKRQVLKTLLQGFSAHMTDGQAIALTRDLRVKAVYEIDNSTYPAATQALPLTNNGLDRNDQRDLPMSNSYTYTWNGAGVIVYVVDTGSNHPYDLGRGSTTDRTILDKSFVTNSNLTDTSDKWNHGHPIATIIAGEAHGVAKAASIVNLKVFDAPGVAAFSDDIAAALDFAVQDRIGRENPPAIINYSASGTSPDPLIESAVMRALNAGIVVVAAAGNDGGDACNKSPGRLGSSTQYANNPNGLSTITVGSTILFEGQDQSWAHSNSGPCVDIHAMASNVRAENPGGFFVQYDNGGTSFATAYVAGVAANYLQYLAQYSPSLATPSGIESVMKDWGTVGKINTLPANTPNLLLYSGMSRHRACCMYP